MGNSPKGGGESATKELATKVAFPSPASEVCIIRRAALIRCGSGWCLKG
jgi:hypothetical protein